MGDQGWPPPHTPDPPSWLQDEVDEVGFRRPIAQHAKQSTAYSFPAAVFWFLAGTVVGALGMAVVAAHSWGVW